MLLSPRRRKRRRSRGANPTAVLYLCWTVACKYLVVISAAALLYQVYICSRSWHCIRPVIWSVFSIFCCVWFHQSSETEMAPNSNAWITLESNFILCHFQVPSQWLHFFLFSRCLLVLLKTSQKVVAKWYNKSVFIPEFSFSRTAYITGYSSCSLTEEPLTTVIYIDTEVMVGWGVSRDIPRGFSSPMLTCLFSACDIWFYLGEDSDFNLLPFQNTIVWH